MTASLGNHSDRASWAGPNHSGGGRGGSDVQFQTEVLVFVARLQKVFNVLSGCLVSSTGASGPVPLLMCSTLLFTNLFIIRARRHETNIMYVSYGNVSQTYSNISTGSLCCLSPQHCSFLKRMIFPKQIYHLRLN